MVKRTLEWGLIVLLATAAALFVGGVPGLNTPGRAFAAAPLLSQRIDFGNMTSCGKPPAAVILAGKNANVAGGAANDSYASNVIKKAVNLTKQVLCVNGSFYALKVTSGGVVSYVGGCEYPSASNAAWQLFKDNNKNGTFTRNTDQTVLTEWHNYGLRADLGKMNWYRYDAKANNLIRVKMQFVGGRWRPAERPKVGQPPTGPIGPNNLFQRLFRAKAFSGVQPTATPAVEPTPDPSDVQVVDEGPAFLLADVSSSVTNVVAGQQISYAGSVVPYSGFNEPVALHIGFVHNTLPFIDVLDAGFTDAPYSQPFKAMADIPKRFPPGDYSVIVWGEGTTQALPRLAPPFNLTISGPALGGVAAYPDLSSGSNVGLLAGVAAAITLAATAGAAWYARRRWVR